MAGTRDIKFSRQLQETFGHADPYKGKLNDTEVVLWDAVQPCDPDSCSLARVNRCRFSHNLPERCTVQMKYVKLVFKTFYAKLGETAMADPLVMHKIGLHVMPLYGHLIKFKLVEASLTSPTFVTEKGDVKIHPVYKEIRQTLAHVETMLKGVFLSIGMKRKDAKDVVDSLGSLDTTVIPPDGDSNYYSELFMSDQEANTLIDELELSEATAARSRVKKTGRPEAVRRRTLPSERDLTVVGGMPREDD